MGLYYDDTTYLQIENRKEVRISGNDKFVMPNTQAFFFIAKIKKGY